MKTAYQIAEARRRRSGKKVTEWLVAHGGQMLLPMLDVLTVGKRKLDQVLSEISAGAIEALLLMSAQQVAGIKERGRRGEEIVWHGSQDGAVPLSDRKVRVAKPRLRRRGVGEGGEVTVPLYQRLWENEALGERMMEILLKGVSTRRYREVLPEMAEAVGIKKSSVSRQMVEASAEALQQLNERRWEGIDLLVIYVDGVRFGKKGKYHVLGAVGVDIEGRKHVLGLREGASENTTVALGLLEDLVARGVDPKRRRLFVIDGSQALRNAIDRVFGMRNYVQRCRRHKIENVKDHLPQEQKEQAEKLMNAAFKLKAKDGCAKIEQYASWLEREYPSAASSLREGLDEMFTVERLGLSTSLQRCLCTTSIIDSSHSGVRLKTERVTRWQGGAMVMRWAAASFLATEKNYRKIQGYKDLWMLEAALTDEPEGVVQDKKAAA